MNCIPFIRVNPPSGHVQYKRLRAREIVNDWTGFSVGSVIQFGSIYDEVMMDWKILTLVYEQPAHLVVTHDNVSVIQAELVMVAQIRGVKVKVFANVPVRRAIEVQL